MCSLTHSCPSAQSFTAGLFPSRCTCCTSGRRRCRPGCSRPASGGLEGQVELGRKVLEATMALYGCSKVGPAPGLQLPSIGHPPGLQPVSLVVCLLLGFP